LKKSEEETKIKKNADKLFDEATKRLNSAVKRKNFDELRLAQGMLFGVKAMRKNEAESSKTVDSLAKVIKTKTQNISSYFSKIQPKK
jgi:hypothetical protein